jgi:hypothetical protein
MKISANVYLNRDARTLLDCHFSRFRKDDDSLKTIRVYKSRFINFGKKKTVFQKITLFTVKRTRPDKCALIICQNFCLDISNNSAKTDLKNIVSFRNENEKTEGVCNL